MTSATTKLGIALPGYTLPEFEELAGIPKKTGYREVKLGRVQGYRDSQGRMRISPFEAFHYLRSREQE